jgi:hypothetical protein
LVANQLLIWRFSAALSVLMFMLLATNAPLPKSRTTECVLSVDPVCLLFTRPPTIASATLPVTVGAGVPVITISVWGSHSIAGSVRSGMAGTTQSASTDFEPVRV